MSSPPLPRVVRFCSALAIGGGILALLGWLLQIDALKSVLPQFVAMNPATAVGFILAGIALGRLAEGGSDSSRRPLVLVCAAAVTLLGGARIAAYLLGFDQPFWAIAAEGNPMAANTATGLLLIGAALLGIDLRLTPRLWWAECLALGTAALALVPLVGYGYCAESFYALSVVPMALNTAVLLQALALGILYARPQRGMMGIISSSALGGMIARRLLPAAILIPCLLGWMRLLGQYWQLYDTEFGAALLVAATIVMFCGVAVWAAAILNRVDAERQRATDALRQSNEQIYDLYSRAPCGHHSLDEDGVFLAVNDTELDWFGCAREEVIGKAKFLDFITAESQQTFHDQFERFKRHGSVSGLEFSLVRRDGTHLPVILNATAIYDADGHYLASRSTLFDATELKQAEQTARQLNAQLERRVKERTAELARSNADLVQKSQENEMFVYGVSHDLRSPLVNLEGFSSELAVVCDELRALILESDSPTEFQQRSLGLLDEDMKQSIHFIQTAVARLSSIIDALLRLSRAGRIEYQWQRVDAADLVARILESMNVSIYNSAALITTGDLPPVYGDPTAIEQVFANLISNAINYLDPQRMGAIEIGSKDGDVASGGGRQGGPASPLRTYYVKDNGLGIPGAYHAKVFQALKRLHPQSAEGEGIGLALVRRIVERHGGEIWFESEEGAGTEFCFTLPLYTQQDVVGETDPENAEGSAIHGSGAFGYLAGRGR